MITESKFIKNLISVYEQDILGNTYTFKLSDGVDLSFRIEPWHIPHLMGIRKIALRQVQDKSAPAIYEMLKNGEITLTHLIPHKEEYKKVKNFPYLNSILHCGDAVHIIKRRGSLNSRYLLYLDHRPSEIIHLGIAYDDVNQKWYPESYLVLQRNVTAYIDGQDPVEIIDFTIT